MQATRRCLLLWHRLQEHGGIHDSHAERLLAREKAAWEAQKRQELEALRTAACSSACCGRERSSGRRDHRRGARGRSGRRRAVRRGLDRDGALPELQRMPEHQRPDVRLQRQQAGLHQGLSAGTYRQLVEAAESCQVAIIHPGKPRNPNEPGLDELLERAKPFQ